ncbi:hypothetical protein GCK72_014258 [Caenorhabditis remanei]|uniref:Uncharacterized protein n=1 Tax=Caenorhabditis remanei TaxID=31234 RepID=A0A6A5GT61_CAERE|nr:hypothetical protein GCK72_014258 [Caenorhabditis remanei]KAF1757801.1 hypothetical protein GCK72_014258 [Caenorhabditis remanei]
MSRRFALIALLFSVTYAQSTTQQSQQISLDPNAGPLKLRIVFQSDQQQQAQQSPCSTGNCGSVQPVQASPCSTGNCQATPTLSPCSTGNCGSIQPVQASPCSTGNCNGPVAGSANIVPAYDASTYTTTTPMPVPIRTVPIVTSNTAPVKVIRIPSYSNSYSSGCFSPPCGAPRFVFAQPPCFGNSCGPRFMFPRRRHHFFGQRPIIIGNRNNGNSFNAGGNVAIPDTIYRNGQAIRAPIRVPSSYQDGNPVFNSGK